MRRFESKNYTQSGGIGINITRNQDTAFGVSLQLIMVVQGQCRLLRFYHSGVIPI